MQNQAAEIKLRAERRAGEMLAERESAQGKRTDIVTSCNEVPTLDDLGITRIQSHRWQVEASVPEEKFERHVAEFPKASNRLLRGLLK